MVNHRSLVNIPTTNIDRDAFCFTQDLTLENTLVPDNTLKSDKYKKASSDVNHIVYYSEITRTYFCDPSTKFQWMEVHLQPVVQFFDLWYNILE